ncbi:hypothetical protein K437DRAFT_83979 [Tilletiaria anomala UBC 951]|uniref:Wings apart-like protein C-terminal domain-containing protein n=1 Tax=Tilletiaria anomala (strain ATCC 24038 / CBS 436.72 / UBC 951) TaxID=1037660 RepID=A0A066W3I4_TILAU|nr:uncharacterized protein K437DRAFT_83979 [Tilletiaria anomala UBC 951]KDN48527.1 hypothetical protein K437DRAFT_83979 [Tilletiaria anomala UBC 951]
MKGAVSDVTQPKSQAPSPGVRPNILKRSKSPHSQGPSLFDSLVGVQTSQSPSPSHFASTPASPSACSRDGKGLSSPCDAQVVCKSQSNSQETTISRSHQAATRYNSAAASKPTSAATGGLSGAISRAKTYGAQRSFLVDASNWSHESSGLHERLRKSGELRVELGDGSLACISERGEEMLSVDAEQGQTWRSRSNSPSGGVRRSRRAGATSSKAAALDSLLGLDTSQAKPKARESYKDLLKKWGEGDLEEQGAQAFMELKSVTSLRSAGENRRFNDELEYLLSGLDTSEPRSLSTRQSSCALIVVEKCCPSPLQLSSNGKGVSGIRCHEHHDADEEGDEGKKQAELDESMTFLRNLQVTDNIQRLYRALLACGCAAPLTSDLHDPSGTLDAIFALYLARLVAAGSGAGSSATGGEKGEIGASNGGLAEDLLRTSTSHRDHGHASLSEANGRVSEHFGGPYSLDPHDHATQELHLCHVLSRMLQLTEERDALAAEDTAVRASRATLVEQNSAKGTAGGPGGSRNRKQGNTLRLVREAVQACRFSFASSHLQLQGVREDLQRPSTRDLIFFTLTELIPCLSPEALRLLSFGGEGSEFDFAQPASQQSEDSTQLMCALDCLIKAYRANVPLCESSGACTASAATSSMPYGDRSFSCGNTGRGGAKFKTDVTSSNLHVMHACLVSILSRVSDVAGSLAARKIRRKLQPLVPHLQKSFLNGASASEQHSAHSGAFSMLVQLLVLSTQDSAENCQALGSVPFLEALLARAVPASRPANISGKTSRELGKEGEDAEENGFADVEQRCLILSLLTNILEACPSQRALIADAPILVHTGREQNLHSSPALSILAAAYMDSSRNAQEEQTAKAAAIGVFTGCLSVLLALLLVGSEQRRASFIAAANARRGAAEAMQQLLESLEDFAAANRELRLAADQQELRNTTDEQMDKIQLLADQLRSEFGSV